MSVTSVLGAVIHMTRETFNSAFNEEGTSETVRLQGRIVFYVVSPALTGGLAYLGRLLLSLIATLTLR
jgi:hypothetical protein